jgi:hypothetical protein
MKLAIVLLLLLTAPAHGLDLNNTMQDWKDAPIEVRLKLLNDTIASRRELGVDRNFVMVCMKQATETRLLLWKPVSEMLEYCMKGDDETEYIH